MLQFSINSITTIFDQTTILFNRNPSRVKSLELVLSCVFIILSLLLFSKFFYTMFTSSLHIDEIYSIQHFSSKGIFVAASDYHAPNNHIFFNVLNSLIPYSNSYDPFRARFLSGIAVLIGLFFLSIIFIKEKAYTEGAWILCIYSLSGRFLDLALQARGYSFLFMFASAITYLTWSYYNHDSTRNKLNWITLCLILGTWTIPSFAIFSFFLFATIFLSVKDKKYLVLLGIIYGFSCFILYLPVIKQLLEVMDGYAEQWGKGFEFGQAIFNTFKTYTPLTKDWMVFALFLWVIHAPFFLFKKQNEMSKFIMVITLSTFLTFLGFLYLETAIIRAASFLIVPISVVAFILFNQILHSKKLIIPKIIIILCISVGVAIQQFIFYKDFHHTPTENHLGVAKFITENFKSGTEVFCNFRPQLLGVYLPPDNPLVEEFNYEKFSKGQLVYIDSEIFTKKRERKYLYNDQMHVVTKTIQQSKGGFQRIYYITPTVNLVGSNSTTDKIIFLNSKCCGWTSNSIKLDPSKERSDLNFTVDFIKKSGDFSFQILAFKDDTCYFWNQPDLQNQLPKNEQYSLSLDNFKKVGDCRLDEMERLIFRVKTSDPEAQNIIQYSNISMQ